MNGLLMYALKDLGVHMTIGFGVCFFWSCLCFYRKKPRRLFRFGGNGPMSLGTRNSWIFWYLVSYVFEFASSFFMSTLLYKEIALSVYQALEVTTGLFIVDRISMMFERKSNWHPQFKIKQEGGFFSKLFSKNNEEKQDAEFVREAHDSWAVDKLENLTAWMKNRLYPKTVEKTTEEVLEKPEKEIETCPSENPSQ